MKLKVGDIFTHALAHANEPEYWWTVAALESPLHDNSYAVTRYLRDKKYRKQSAYTPHDDLDILCISDLSKIERLIYGIREG